MSVRMEAVDLEGNQGDVWQNVGRSELKKRRGVVPFLVDHNFRRSIIMLRP